MQKTITRLSFYAVFCAIGIFVAFYPALIGGPARIPFELGDFRLNHYFLEHSWQWIHNSQYKGGLYSPSFFFPFKNVLTFSDNLFGSAPIYWLLRLFITPDVAFIGWFILVSCLNFASMTFVLRQEKVHPLLAALGGFIFAFPMMRVLQLTHSQLFPEFCAPLALWLTWQFFKSADLRKFCGILFLVYWQILCGIYLGWFLMLALLILGLVVIAVDKKGRSNLWYFLRNSWGPALAAVVLWGGGLYALLSPYVRAKELIGGTPYKAIAELFLPKLNSWILVPPTNNLWSNLLGHLSGNLPVFYEHWIFHGLIVSLAVAMAIISLLRKCSGTKPGGLDGDQRQTVKVFLLTGLVIILLSLNFSNGLSLWMIVYKVIPGASAIRAISRIALIVLPCLIIAGFISLNSWIHRFDRQRVLQMFLLVSITTFGILEQRIDGTAYDPNRAQTRVVQAELSQLIKQYCQVAYLSPTNPEKPPSATPAIEIIYSQIDAMWAGITANRPVINGYSGFSPPGFSLIWWDKTQVVSWLQAQKSPPIDRLCFIQKKGSQALPNVAATAPPLERQQSAHYHAEIMRYP